MLTHRNKKPYECKAMGCGKSYCDARSLRRHIENHHNTKIVKMTTTGQPLTQLPAIPGNEAMNELNITTGNGNNHYIAHYSYCRVQFKV